MKSEYPSQKRLSEIINRRFKFGVRANLRLMKSSFVFSPRLLKLLLQRRKPTPGEVREVFESMGTTYIKLGQFIASSPSLFPQEYVLEFQKCLDQTPNIPYARVKRIVESQLKAPLSELFAEFEKTPLASASIAQVHAAKLHNGDDVVVKVQKPGVADIISTDLNVVFVLLRLTEWLTPGMSKEMLTSFVEEIYRYMIDECDFIKEANNLVEFNEFLLRSGNRDVVCPQPYAELSSAKVLTMERLYGITINDRDALFANSSNPSEVVLHAMNTWFASLTQCDFFHADLHSGNVMLLDDGRVGFIDFGMIGRIPENAWQAVFDLAAGFEVADAKKIATAMIEIGMTSAEVDRDQLTKDVAELIHQMTKEVSYSGTDIAAQLMDELDTMMLEAGKLARRHGIHFPQSFTLLLKQFLYFDRYIDQLAPDLSVFGDDRLKLIAR